MTPRCLISAVSTWARLTWNGNPTGGWFWGDGWEFCFEQVGFEMPRHHKMQMSSSTGHVCRVGGGDAWPRVIPDGHEIAEGAIVDGEVGQD